MKTKKTKPILFIQFSRYIGERELKDIRPKLNDKIKDYYVITTTSTLANTKIEVFYEKDFNAIKYKELKEIIKNSIKKI
jgi:hypothetical protein